MGEGYLEKVGRLNAARMQAEEKVLAELVLLAPEDEEEDDSLPPEDRRWFDRWREIMEEDSAFDFGLDDRVVDVVG